MILWSCLSSILNDSCSWMDTFFNRFGDFSAMVLLNIFSMPLTRISSPFIFLIHQVGLLMVYHVPHIFFCNFFIIVSLLSSKCSYLSTLSSDPTYYSAFYSTPSTGEVFHWVFYLFFIIHFISKISICFLLRIFISLLNSTVIYYTDFLISLNQLIYF